MQEEPSINSFINSYDTNIQHLITLLRNFIIQNVPNINEILDVQAKIIGYGFGTGYKDTIYVIIPSKKGVKLGFYKGIELPDPTTLLEGKGKVHKYVVITSDTIYTQALINLIQNAYKFYLKRKS